jgi:hypothetical protein
MEFFCACLALALCAFLIGYAVGFLEGSEAE